MWSDTEFAGCKRIRRSTSGGVVMIGSHCVKTYSSTQDIIALSSGEAEFYGMDVLSMHGCEQSTRLSYHTVRIVVAGIGPRFVVCQSVGTVPDVVGVLWPSFNPKSGSKSQISCRTLKSCWGLFSSAELSRLGDCLGWPGDPVPGPSGSTPGPGRWVRRGYGGPRTRQTDFV
jgi:hypothetical protein